MAPFFNYLSQRLSGDLPGRDAQHKMAPKPTNGKAPNRLYNPENNNYRNSSVLVPLIESEDSVDLILTLRTSGIKHGGQISFPGGGREGDETIEETALREAREEIGLIEHNVDVIGRLSSLYISHSENMVTPVVGFIRSKQEFTPNPNEVDEVFTVSMTDLAGDEYLSNKEWDLKGMPYYVPYWDVHQVPLWGATAMMLSELIHLYQDFLEDPDS